MRGRPCGRSRRGVPQSGEDSAGLFVRECHSFDEAHAHGTRSPEPHCAAMALQYRPDAANTRCLRDLVGRTGRRLLTIASMVRTTFDCQ